MKKNSLPEYENCHFTASVVLCDIDEIFYHDKKLRDNYLNWIVKNKSCKYRFYEHYEYEQFFLIIYFKKHIDSEKIDLSKNNLYCVDCKQVVVDFLKIL